jgi:glycosyltransferase involved in cell wall biosynthesis
VLGDTGLFFADPVGLAGAVLQVEATPGDAAKRGEAARERAAMKYEWDDVAAGYEALCASLRELHGRR